MGNQLMTTFRPRDGLEANRSTKRGGKRDSSGKLSAVFPELGRAEREVLDSVFFARSGVKVPHRLHLSRANSACKNARNKSFTHVVGGDFLHFPLSKLRASACAGYNTKNGRRLRMSQSFSLFETKWIKKVKLQKVKGKIVKQIKVLFSFFKSRNIVRNKFGKCQRYWY